MSTIVLTFPFIKLIILSTKSFKTSINITVIIPHNMAYSKHTLPFILNLDQV